MAFNFTRRRFLGWSQAAAAAMLTSGAPAMAVAESSSNDDYYEKLGVDKFINAAGTYTYMTASIMPASVQRAVAQAALHPVLLEDLQKKAGEYLAKRLRCEGAVVTSGACGALTLATAACVVSANGCRPDQLPQDASGMKNEVIVQKAHRYEYDHAMQLAGIKIVEVVTVDDYKRAFTEKTVMTNYFNAAPGGEIDRKNWLDIAHQHQVPCHMDAAADMPPISNLWNYTGMGFDLVCFSGGKGIRGPQNAGLLLGRKHLTDLAAANNNPADDVVGRGMKVAKEQIVGMVAAVDCLLEQSDEGIEKECMQRAEIIMKAVKSVPTMKADVYVPEIANHVPHVILAYDPQTVGITPKEVKKRLREQTPHIELNPSTGVSGSQMGTHANENTIVVGVWMLQPGEAEIVGRRLNEVLSHPNA